MPPRGKRRRGKIAQKSCALDNALDGGSGLCRQGSRLGMDWVENMDSGHSKKEGVGSLQPLRAFFHDLSGMWALKVCQIAKICVCQMYILRTIC